MRICESVIIFLFIGVSYSLFQCFRSVKPHETKLRCWMKLFYFKVLDWFFHSVPNELILFFWEFIMDKCEDLLGEIWKQYLSKKKMWNKLKLIFKSFSIRTFTLMVELFSTFYTNFNLITLGDKFTFKYWFLTVKC